MVDGRPPGGTAPHEAPQELAAEWQTALARIAAQTERRDDAAATAVAADAEATKQVRIAHEARETREYAGELVTYEYRHARIKVARLLQSGELTARDASGIAARFDIPDDCIRQAGGEPEGALQARVAAVENLGRQVEEGVPTLLAHGIGYQGGVPGPEGLTLALERENDTSIGPPQHHFVVGLGERPLFPLRRLVEVDPVEAADDTTSWHATPNLEVIRGHDAIRDYTARTVEWIAGQLATLEEARQEHAAAFLGQEATIHELWLSQSDSAALANHQQEREDLLTKAGRIHQSQLERRRQLASLVTAAYNAGVHSIHELLPEDALATARQEALAYIIYVSDHAQAAESRGQSNAGRAYCELYSPEDRHEAALALARRSNQERRERPWISGGHSQSYTASVLDRIFGYSFIDVYASLASIGGTTPLPDPRLEPQPEL